MVALPSAPRTRIVHLESTLNQFSLMGIAFVLGIVFASAYDRVPDLWAKKAQLQHVESVDVPKLKREIVVEKVATAKAQAKAVEANKEKQAVIESVNGVADPPTPRLKP